MVHFNDLINYWNGNNANDLLLSAINMFIQYQFAFVLTIIIS